MGTTTSKSTDSKSNPPPLKIPRLYNPTVLLTESGLMEEGAVFQDDELTAQEFSFFTGILSNAGIVGPVIAWGDIAMMFHGVPICFSRYHVLIPDATFEDARKALQAEGFVDLPSPHFRWTDIGPCCQMHNPGRPELFSSFLIFGLSAVRPVFDDFDITGYKQIGGIVFPPLHTLALSFLHALSRSKRNAGGLCLYYLLKCWCGYCRDLGYKPLGPGAMNDLPNYLQVDEKLMSFWATGVYSRS